MKGKKPQECLKFSMVNIGIMEISCGVLALSWLIELLTYELRSGTDPGRAWALLPGIIAGSLYVVLGAVVLLRSQFSKLLHILVVPVISAVIVATAIFVKISTIRDFVIVGLYLLAGAISVFYNYVSCEKLDR